MASPINRYIAKLRSLVQTAEDAGALPTGALAQADSAFRSEHADYNHDLRVKNAARDLRTLLRLEREQQGPAPANSTRVRQIKRLRNYLGGRAPEQLARLEEA